MISEHCGLWASCTIKLTFCAIYRLMRVEYCVILLRLTLTFVGALEDSDVHNGENCGAAPSFGPPTGMIFSSCSS